MKKCLSLILVLCLMISAATVAFAEKKVYQDEAMPAVVSVPDGQGGEAAALIYDAAGNVVGAVDQINGMCICQRENAQDAELAALMENALAAVMKGQHSDRSAWQVASDLFYVEIPAEYAEIFADGSACMSMNLATAVLEDGVTFQAMFSADGENWIAVEDACIAGGAIQFSIPQSGMVLFLADHADVFTRILMPGDEAARDQVEGEEASNFTPSASGKLAPAVAIIDDNGRTCDAVIMNGADEVVSMVPSGQWIVVTPLSESRFNPDVLTYEQLQWAYESICAASDIGALPLAGQEGTLAETINGMLQATGTGLSCADMTVSDLFEVSVYGEYCQQLKVEGNAMKIAFECAMDPEDTLIVLCADEIGGWYAMDAEDVVINANGTLTLRMENDGVVAFLVESAAPVADSADAVMAP